RLVLVLAPADDELILLDRDLELLTGEPGDSQRDSQTVRFTLRARQPLDVVRRIPVRRRLGDAVERPLDLVKAEQKRGRQGRYTRHCEALSGTSEPRTRLGRRPG